MNILFIGDIVGKVGRNAVCDLLSDLKNKYSIDFTICNGENSAHGKGITSKIYNQLIESGIDAITMGNHTYSKKEIIDHIKDLDRLIVPSNIKNKVGNGYRVFNINNKKICVINLLGKDLMGEYMDSPYEELKKILISLPKDIDIKLLDFHAESTAEKRIFFELFKKDINIFIGTHTHIQTADEDIINGSAYISDVGMCGPYLSIIGRDINESIEKYVYNTKTQYTVSENDAIVCGCVIKVDDNNKIESIERIQIRPKK